jgi:DNA segregation ATPase FtsK/SpoIIIE, S-DNA-T family
MSEYTYSSALQADANFYQRPSEATRRPGALSKALGAAILVAATLATVSLMTWSANDPSLTHLSTAKPTNALGALGAIFSDLIMTSLGLAGVLALTPPFFWALQLLSGAPVDRFKAKLVLTPFAVFAVAAFLSSLPKSALWPLQPGYGGLLGDVALSAFTSVIAAASIERAGLIAAALSCVGGFGLLILSIGLTAEDFKTLVQRAKRHFEPDSSWVSRLKSATASLPPMPLVSPVAQPNLTVPAVTLPPLSLTPEMLTEWTQHHGHHHHGYAEQTQRQPEPALEPARAPAPIAAPVAKAEAPAPAPQPIAPSRPAYRLPPTSLLPKTTTQRASALEMSLAEKFRADRLRDVLAEFSVLGEVKDHLTGPVVTTFVFEPQAGTRTTRVLGMANEIAQALGVPAVRLQLAAGRSSLIIEVPHDDAIAIGIRDLIEHDDYTKSHQRLPLALAATAQGEPVIADLAAMPSLLFTGAFEDERAAAVRGAIASLIHTHTPAKLQLAIADASGCLGAFAALPHCGGHAPAVSAADAVELLSWAASEIDARTLRLRAMAQARSIEDYNARVSDAPQHGLEPMPYLVVAITDLAPLVLSDAPAFEYALHRIVRDGAAVGVHLLAATSRVDDHAFPESVRAAFPTRIAFKLAGRPESRTVLGDTGAEDLLGQGDALAITARDDVRRVFGGGAFSRLHTTRVSLEDAIAITAAVTLAPQGAEAPVMQARVPVWQPAPTRVEDALYDRALALVRREQTVDPTVLRRNLGISYGDALILIEQMAHDRIVSAADASGYRTILIGRAA